MPAHVYNPWQLITNSESSKSAGSRKDFSAARNPDELKIIVVVTDWVVLMF